MAPRRGSGQAARVVSVVAGDRTRRVSLEDDGVVIVTDETFTLTTAPAAGEVIVSRGLSTERVFVTTVNDTRWVFHNGETFELTVEAEGSLRRRVHHQGSLTAPMPATVVSVHARPGEHVTRGMTLIVLEAMKMELPVRAQADGTVTAVHCRPGELVQPGVPLIEVQ
jgi:biotin carboxyl carrier protein